jgi:hypothetical protein
MSFMNTGTKQARIVEMHLEAEYYPLGRGASCMNRERSKKARKHCQASRGMSLFPHLYVDPVSRASSVFDGPSYERNQESQDTPEAVSTESHRTWHSAAEQAATTLIVISGGTGCNAICSAFSQAYTCYVLPVTDDGGSSSEIIRVIGQIFFAREVRND